MMKRMTLKHWVLLLVTMTLPWAAWAGDEDGETERLSDQGMYEIYAAHAGDSMNRLTPFRIRGWVPVTREALVVETNRREHFLVDLRGGAGCEFRPGFVKTLDIGQKRGQRSSLAKLDTVTIDGEYRCTVTNIRPLDMEAAGEALADYQLPERFDGESVARR